LPISERGPWHQDEKVVPEPLAELFSSRVRAAVLALVLPRPHLRFSLTELSRRLGLPVSSLQHECYKLTRLGLLRDERVGNARLYRPDPAWPLLEPLTALTVRAMPPEEALRGAVEGVPGIEGAWVSGDLGSPPAPVYVVIVGNLGVEELDSLFDRCRVALVPVAGATRIELAYFRPADWTARLARGDPFTAALRESPQIELCAFAREERRGPVAGAGTPPAGAGRWRRR
jgi:DNA-binding transcriptional ArsR family regulator